MVQDIAIITTATKRKSLWSIKRRHNDLERTPKLNLKVTPLFNAEYFRKHTRYET